MCNGLSPLAWESLSTESKNVNKHKMTETKILKFPRRFLSSSASSSAVSPILYPGNEDGEFLLIVHDKAYGFHGKILMLVLVLSFALFLVIVVALPFLKRNTDFHLQHSDSIDELWNCHSRLRKARRISGDAASGESLHCSNHISRISKHD